MDKDKSLHLSGKIDISWWGEEAVAYHVPSASLIAMNPPISSALEVIRSEPITLAELTTRLIPGEPSGQLEAALERLLNAGILRYEAP